MAKKNYYNNELVNSMLLEYQNIVETECDSKGHKIVINKTPRVEYLETQITNEIRKVVKAIIFLYRYDRYNIEYEELEAIGTMACFQNYLKFDPEFGNPSNNSFNFFSLIVKKCLYGVTTRHSKKIKKKVYLEDLGDAVHASKEFNMDKFIGDLNDMLTDIINENFLRKTRRKYLMITDVICDYLLKTQAYISKTDMYRFCGGYGLRASDIRLYVNDLSKYYKELSQLIEFEPEDDFKDQSVSSGEEDDK